MNKDLDYVLRDFLMHGNMVSDQKEASQISSSLILEKSLDTDITKYLWSLDLKKAFIRVTRFMLYQTLRKSDYSILEN